MEGPNDGTFWASYNDAAIGRSGVASFTMRAALLAALPVLENDALAGQTADGGILFAKGIVAVPEPTMSVPALAGLACVGFAATRCRTRA